MPAPFPDPAWADIWAVATGATLTARVGRARAAIEDPSAGAALLAEAAVLPFADPAWDDTDGRPALRGPAPRRPHPP